MAEILVHTRTVGGILEQAAHVIVIRLIMVSTGFVQSKYTMLQPQT